MQKFGKGIIDTVKKVRIKNLESEIKDFIFPKSDGEIFICPFCNYESNKNRKGTAKIFSGKDGISFKCFACGKWRKIK